MISASYNETCSSGLSLAPCAMMGSYIALSLWLQVPVSLFSILWQSGYVVLDMELIKGLLHST